MTLGKAFEQSIDGDKKSYTMRYIDWEHPENNVYHVTEEFAVTRTGSSDTYRPDIVLFDRLRCPDYQDFSQMW